MQLRISQMAAKPSPMPIRPVRGDRNLDVTPVQTQPSAAHAQYQSRYPLTPRWIVGALCLVNDGVWRTHAADIELANGRILALHPPGTAEQKIDEGEPAGEAMIDASRMLAIPGLINAHFHSPDQLIRGSAPDLPLELWSLHSAAGRDGRGLREIELAVQLGCIEMMRGGITTVLDHLRLSPDLDREGLEVAARAYSATGMRAVVAPVLADRPVAATMPLSVEDLAGADIAAYGTRPTLPWREQLAVVDDFAASWGAGRVTAAVGPSGPQRCSDELLRAAGEMSARRNLVLHMHVLETQVQRAMGLQLYGTPMLAHLDELGLLSDRANLVHAVWLEPGDVERIARRGAAVIHNPVSNARLGSGTCNLPALLRAGVRVALGTDSACCNDGVSILETMKWAALLPRLTAAEADWPLAGNVLTMATAGAADAIGLGRVTGALRSGLAADITLLRLDSPSFVPLHDAVRQLVQGETGAAVDTMLVDGRVTVRGGVCTLIDEAAVWQEARALSARRMYDNKNIYRNADALAAPIRRMRARLCGCAG